SQGAEKARDEAAQVESDRAAADDRATALAAEHEALLAAIRAADTVLSADDAKERGAQERLEAAREERGRLEVTLTEQRLGHDHQADTHVARALSSHLRGGEREAGGNLPEAIQWWQGSARAHYLRGIRGTGRRDRRPARREKAAIADAALRRREGSHRRLAHPLALPDPADALLSARRGRRSAGRGEHRSLQPGGARDGRVVAVHAHHAQSTHDGGSGHAVRHHHGAGGGVESG